MRYVSVACVVGIIAGFCIGPGEDLTEQEFSYFHVFIYIRLLKVTLYICNSLNRSYSMNIIDIDNSDQW